MASFLSANMSLVVPTVGVEIGPNWASDLNASLLIIDAHTHNPGSGVQITPSGININTDLGFNSNNAVALRSSRFTPQAMPIEAAADLGCLYEAGVDLYYNDGAGNQIRITQSGSVAGSSGTITGLPSGTASAAYDSGSGTFQFQQATSTGANLDVASVIIRYPGSYPTPAGNAIMLEAPSSLNSLYALTLPSLPAQTNVMTLTAEGIISSTTYDAVGQGMSSVGADAIGVSMTLTGANAIANSRTRATGTSSEGVGGIAISASCGAFAVTSPTITQITNLEVQLATSGRPVMLMLISDGSSISNAANVNGSSVASLFFFNGSTNIGTLRIGPQPAGPLYVIDFAVSGVPGTYSYTAQANTTSGSFNALFLKLVAFEL